MYLDGRGIPKDYAAAIQWFRKAADKGNRYGFWNLATMYEKGFGVQKDGHKAEEYYRKAARKGHKRAQKLLKKRGLKW